MRAATPEERASRPASDTPTLISLFTGAGGLDLGLEMAGFRTVTALDNDRRCIETLETNQARRIIGPHDVPYLAGARIVGASVADVTGDDLRPDAAPRTWRPDLLAGGPPCQPFSSAGKQMSLDDPRGRLFEHFVRIARELRPRYILFENVRGIVTARGPSGEPGEVLHRIRGAFEELGYGTSFALLNAADYGLPQRRVRCFMMAALRGVVPQFPAPTHGSGSGFFTHARLKPWVTLRSFLQGRPEPTPTEVVRPTPRLSAKLHSLPEGSGLKSPGAREATRPGGHWGYKQGTFIADQSKPARTVTAAATQDWVRSGDGTLRRLTVRECASLQGFPDDWEFAGSQADRFRQVGNAVPTVFGSVLGEVLRRTLLEHAGSKAKAHSVPFPEKFAVAIQYTRREAARNGPSRARVRSLDDTAREQSKGIGNAERTKSMPLFDRQSR